MKKVAIVGTGMTGMSAAYFLKDHFDLTIFEKNNYIGGHTKFRLSVRRATTLTSRPMSSSEKRTSSSESPRAL